MTLRQDVTLSTIFPRVRPSWTRRCASAASASGRTSATSTRTVPLSIRSAVDQVGDPGERGAVRLHQEGGRFQPPRTGRLQHLRRHTGRDRHDRAARPQGFQRAGGRRVVPLADQVDDDIDVAHDLLEADLRVVHDLVRAQLAQPVVLRGARRADDMGPEVLGELHRQVSHAARRRVDQYPLTRFHARRVHERLPGGQARQRHGRRRVVVDRAGLERELPRGRRHILGVRGGRTREPGHPVHLVAHLQRVHTEADLRHDTGHVPAQDERRCAEETGHATALTGLPVDRIHARRVDPYQHLGGNRGGPRAFGEAQHLGAAEGVLGDRAHGRLTAHVGQVSWKSAVDLRHRKSTPWVVVTRKGHYYLKGSDQLGGVNTHRGAKGSGSYG